MPNALKIEELIYCIIKEAINESFEQLAKRQMEHEDKVVKNLRGEIKRCFFKILYESLPERHSPKITLLAREENSWLVLTIIKGKSNRTYKIQKNSLRSKLLCRLFIIGRVNILDMSLEFENLKDPKNAIEQTIKRIREVLNPLFGINCILRTTEKFVFELNAQIIVKNYLHTT